MKNHALEDLLHPVIEEWFAKKFPGGPTLAQELAIPHITKRQNTLISAPTGSGKTLAGFLVGLSQIYQERSQENQTSMPNMTSVIYVSPLKALANDIRENLITPLSEMEQLSKDIPKISIASRTGDTPQSARTAMLKNPPDLLVTTPESLYLLVTAEKSREMLRQVETVIVDEIHALARDKRGSHLSLTLERLAHISTRQITRIGLSATQKPIETLADFLTGSRADRDNSCQIVDTGMQKELDLGIELPPGELQAVAPTTQLDDTVRRLAELIQEHNTTLIFVNTRRMAERVAHLISEHMEDEDQRLVAAHHGSLSLARRERVEARLRAGELKALVATASLELGIDIGPVNLVCQLGSPRSFAGFIQRVGRANHGFGGVPKGRIFPFTRDDLLECNAIFSGIKKGMLDEIIPPEAPLDILAQQLVAECSAEPWNLGELFELVRGAWTYRNLTQEKFLETLDFTSEGVQTGYGKKGAYIHLDKINQKAEGRKNARLNAIRSGGAIPDVADYRVVAEPDDTYVGTVHEDFAVESMVGDVFLLGTHPWQIIQTGAGTIRVRDATGQSPTVPFWLGEAPARTKELSLEISELNSGVLGFMKDNDLAGAEKYLVETCGIQVPAAKLSVEYLAESHRTLGSLPSQDQIIIERFLDDTGGAQLVVHNPRGGRINKALGLALRKRFCRTFDFELQAAANDNAALISLGPQHSFPLSDVAKFLNSNTVIEVLEQAVLQTPLFMARWRFNLNRSLTIPRFKGSRKNPPPIQRMEADDIMAVVFPQLAACQDNNIGPIEIPDHLLVRQTMDDVMTEALDGEGLKNLVRQIEKSELEVHLVETTDPSPLSHEILNGKPYTFLDDAPLEERRSRAVSLKRDPSKSLGLEEVGGIQEEAIEKVIEEVAPNPESANELYDLLMSLIVLPAPRNQNPENESLASLYEVLKREGRVESLFFERVEYERVEYWCAKEMEESASLLLQKDPDLKTLVEAVRGYLEISGPLKVQEILQAGQLPVPESTLTSALYQLENEGFAIRGRWPETAAERWISRRLLARIHAYSKKSRRQAVKAVSAQDFLQFLLRWQHIQPGYQTNGVEGLASVIFQLQGMELPISSWESHIFSQRVNDYSPSWLDQLCYSGEIAWGRLSKTGAPKSSAGATTRATPISFFSRQDLSLLMSVANQRRQKDIPLGKPKSGTLAEVYEILSDDGAQFFSELVQKTGRLPSDVENGLWDGVAAGLLTADSFGAVRSLFFSRKVGKVPSRRQARRRFESRFERRFAGRWEGRWEGRWALLTPAPLECPDQKERADAFEDNTFEDNAFEDLDERAEEWASQLLERWGVVFYDLMARESHTLPWRNILWALRRLEARGVILGGRFVAGFSGEQFALPEAAEDLHNKREPENNSIAISAADPLNLTGILFKDKRIPALSGTTINLMI